MNGPVRAVKVGGDGFVVGNLTSIPSATLYVLNSSLQVEWCAIERDGG
jgi:hypothetical protein